MNRSNGALALTIGLSAALLTGRAVALPEDRTQPIRVTADNAVQQDGTVTYRGAVVIEQGTLRIEGETVIVNHVAGRVQKLTATGRPARLQQQPEPAQGLVRAAAQTLIYHQAENRIELLREARVERDGSTISGDHIEYLIDSETVRARGDRGSSRVEMVLQPGQAAGKAAPAEEAPAAADPAPTGEGR
jgi:lipopolysaccharide export system protein LptA